MSMKLSARTDSVRIKLSPEMNARVLKLSEAFGMPPSTFCAFAVGDYVRRQEAQSAMTQAALLQVIHGIDNQVDPAMIEKMVETMLPTMAAMSQKNLPLDHEEAETSK